LGNQVAQYAANKHRGGSSGNKGTRYEDYFIAYQVIQAATVLLDDADASNPFIQSQVYGFVDDVRIATAHSTDYYQLKNKDAASWTAGPHPLCTDFAFQSTLAAYLEEPAPRTKLVLASAENAAAMSNSVPEHIRHHTEVQYFPWCGTPNRHVLELAELLSKTCAKMDTFFSCPEPSY
jgi:hypothetical protein